MGDIVNRGPKSLKTLRFIKSLGDKAVTVLGNHDLHLLAVANNIRRPHKKDSLDSIINADDADELLNWLRQQSLLVYDAELGYAMVHAGLPPQWTLDQAIKHAKETETMIRSDRFDDFLRYMYGDQPEQWSDHLEDYDRYRYIINCYTRMRYFTLDGKLALGEKSAPGKQAKHLIPWYAMPDRQTKSNNIIFGHWSTVTLGNESNFKQYNVFPLDTGCLWGGKLTAMRLEDEQHFSVPSLQPPLKK